MNIVGAGLSGLLAAHAWPTARVFELAPGPAAAHRALLRFRGAAVSKLTGIEFEPVLVRKGIWFEGNHVAPSIRLANLYARKVTGVLAGDRSIWSLEPVQRWVAPESFYEQMVEAVGARINWGFDALMGADSIVHEGSPFISTVPLPLLLKALCLTTATQFNRSPIIVLRYRLPPGTALNQTVYFPDSWSKIYRASITGSLLIVEAVGEDFKPEDALGEVLKAFGMEGVSVDALDSVQQRFGKIVPLPAAERKALLGRLTAEHGVFSLGRFATWRNVLLDDVVEDIAVLRRLMRASAYERRLFAS